MLALGLLLTQSVLGAIPSIPLNNAADPSLRMPVVGLGTFGYAPYGGDPENW